MAASPGRFGASTSSGPPSVPPKHDSPSSLMAPRHSPSVTRGRVQPLGTTQQQRQQQQQQASPVVVARKRSFSASSGFKLARSASLPGQSRAAQQPTTEQQQYTTINTVFCDVIVDDLETTDAKCTYPALASRFFERLGTRVLSDPSAQERRTSAKRATPRKQSKPDEAAVRRHLRELHDTEKSYLVKIQSLEKHFARPLRTFARDKNTAVIDTFSAAHLFINIEQLVPISQHFARDLAQVKLFLTHTSKGLPPGFGDMILDNVRNMEPFKKWLAAYASADALRRELERNSTSFRQFVERKQVESREETGQTGGFTEFLAEPFQRVSRYRLMLDPIVTHLDPLDDNVGPLEQAIEILTDICAMETDDATAKAATLWALMETVESFPANMVGYDRTFLGALDVDEIVEAHGSTDLSTSTRSSSYSLRCSLLLFSDKVMIVKRPSSQSTRSTMQQTCLDDPDTLVSMYRASQLSSSTSTSNVVTQLLSSPRKSTPSLSLNSSGSHSLKKNSLGYRGVVDLLQLESVDTDGLDLTLLFDRPPMDQASERWCGRPVRRYVVASVYGDEEAKKRSKDKWMDMLHQAQCKLWMELDCKGVWKSLKDGANARVFWVAWDRRDWERTSRKGPSNKTALYLDDRDGESADLTTGPSGNPLTIARAMPLGQDRVRFSVKSYDRPMKATETIPFERIISAVAELGAPNLSVARGQLQSFGGGQSRPRPRSAIISAALDVFSGGATSLKRIHSTTSRVSNATTTVSWLSSTDDRPSRLSAASVIRETTAAAAAVEENVERQKRLSQRSAPDLSARSMANEELMHVDEAPQSKGGAQPRFEPVATRSISDAKHHQRTMSMPCYGRDEDATTATDLAPFEDAPEDVSFNSSATIAPMSVQPPLRRRMMGPRAPGEVRSSPVRARDQSMLEPSLTPTRATSTLAPSTPERSVDSVKRRLFEESPRRTPAKRASVVGDAQSMPRGPSPSQSRRIPSSSGTARIPSSSQYSRRISNRVVSGASAARNCSPPQSASQPLPSESVDVFDEEYDTTRLASVDTRDPIEVLKSHVQELKTKISFDPAVGKENDRIVSPSGLSRSPHTRNVTLKAAATSSSAYVTSFADSRKAAATIDVPALLRWTDKLSTLVDCLDKTAMSSEPSPVGPTRAEVDLLEQERDLLMAENKALKEQAAKHDEANSAVVQALADSRSETMKLRQAYEDILSEVSTAYDEFNERLDFVVLTLQQEASSRDPEFTRLSTELVQTVKDKVAVERRLREVLSGRR
ncbi:hypothetical protein ACM66B_006239 [Microbotryomycetes sp. NB124-2]